MKLWMCGRNISRIIILAVFSQLTIATANADLSLNPIQSQTTISKLSGNAQFKSRQGRDLSIYRFTPQTKTGKNKQPQYKFLVQGGIHGDETTASEFVHWLALQYANGKSLLNTLPQDKVAIDFLPIANPDGANAGSRNNAFGVNLNRNFGVLWGVTREYPGTKSFSEPETQAVRYLFKMQNYTAAVDVHGYINWVVTPSSPEQIKARGMMPSAERENLYHRWLNALRENLKMLPNYEIKSAVSLGDGGAFEDWAFWSEGTLSYCFEIEAPAALTFTHRNEIPSKNEIAANQLAAFKRYEVFIHQMFLKAIQLNVKSNDTHQLAAQ